MIDQPPSLHPAWPRLAALVTEMFPELSGQPVPGLPLTELPGYDSFMRINLVLAAEAAFGLHFSAKQMAALRRLSDFLPPSA